MLKVIKRFYVPNVGQINHAKIKNPFLTIKIRQKHPRQSFEIITFPLIVMMAIIK